MKKRSPFDWVIDSAAFLAGILLVGTVLIICFEVLMRYFFRSSQIWTVEVCEYALFLITFLGTPWLLKVGGHVSIDVVTGQFGEKNRHLFGLLSTSVGVIISAVIFWFALVTSWNCYQTGVVVTKTLVIPKHYFLVMISLGYILLLFEFGRQWLNHLRVFRGGD